ncbi:MAG: leucine-rich repeat domain-containing protein [Cytophagaceae bacterium]
MNRTCFILLFLFTFLSFRSSAQVDVLNVPSPAEKNEVLQAIKAYSALINIMRTDNDNLRKKISTEFSKRYLLHHNMHVWNDTDPKAGPDDNVRIFAYTMNLNTAYPPTHSIVLNPDQAKLSKVKYDKIRRYYFIETEVVKSIQWTEIKDTLVAINDSIAADTVIARKDTISHSIDMPLVFHIKFDKYGNEARDFKILGITHPQGKPVLDALNPLQTWWLEMDPEWKSYIRTQHKLDEYPTILEIQRVTGTYELVLTNSKFKNYSGLSHFKNVQKLDLEGAAINTLEDIKGMTGLRVLNISKTNINDLSGIESLTNLEELICRGQKIKSLAPLKGLKNLIELDASENELEDIEALAGLENLKKLDISLNYSLKDIKPVSGLVNIEKLAMRKLEIKTLEPIRNLTNLIYLDCFNSGIETLEPIRNHRKLMHLDCSHNKLTSLEPIKNHVFITDLLIAGTNIADLSDIKDFQYLRSFIGNNSSLTSLGPLHKFDTLLEIKVHYTRIDKNEIQRFKKNHPNCKITYF